MPEWFQTSLTSGTDVPAVVLLWRIATALILGAAVAGLYRWARRGQSVEATFLVTLVLLSTVIAMATQVIGDNAARAFSLVGALSVVRFRTVVKDTQDTAFVIFSVVAGMAAGANHLTVALVGLAVIGVASFVLWPRRAPDGWRATNSKLSLRVAFEGGGRAAAESLLAGAADSFELVSAGTARQGSSLDLGYRIRLRPGYSPAGFVAELNSLEGVEGVELKQGD